MDREKMPKPLIVFMIGLIAALTISPLLRAQTWSTQAGPVKDNKAGSSPRRDLTGVWDTQEGIQATGAKNEPSDGKHILPYTPLGESSFKANKPGWGVTGVAVAQVNDPVDICDPQGFPRVWLHNLRTTEIVQTPTPVLILYEFYKVWRSIWTDGRELPKDAADDPRWYGYSVGKWVSDDTFVAQTVGLDERTWLDNTGRPHSKDLRVEERFHRVDHDTLELTVTIDDPQMYTKPWTALDKLALHLQPAGFDIMETMCSPSETAEYNKSVGTPAGDGTKK